MSGVTARSEFEACDAENLTLNALLYQGGYLTIESYNEKAKSYRLRIPNDEIRETLDQGYVRECLEFTPGFTMTNHSGQTDVPSSKLASTTIPKNATLTGRW